MADLSAQKALLAGMLNKPLYAAFRTPRDLSQMHDLLGAHLQWAIDAERRGELFASGPFVSDHAAPGELGGMSILRAADMAEAERLMQADPFIANGVFNVEIRKWMLMEGGLTVHVTFSDKRASLL
ncbi:YciI family protein [Pseudomonas sp. NPDC090208]|uniref:YciI family protein n=1 Tax=Pseudomonas sp. NPDC090208 TaxID=3364478 RepID=UPI00381D4B2F